MQPIDKQACEYLACLWCIQNMPWINRPSKWAKAHWFEFYDELDSRTGEMWLEIFKRERDREREAAARECP